MPEQVRQVGNVAREMDTSRRLDLERTHIAYEQSMMTWIRTAIALITFGFTIYRFFQLELPGRAEKIRLIGPREFGTTLVSLGLVSLVLATLEHRRCQRVLREQWPDAPRSLAVWLAGMISILGTVALLVMIFRQ
jgi:putative membrane protein